MSQIHHIEWDRYLKQEYGIALQTIPVGDMVTLPVNVPNIERYVWIPILKPLPAFAAPYDGAVFTDATKILCFERIRSYGDNSPDLWKRVE
jgi:hypothetical protein